jgi:hypothetical protein
VLLGNGEKPPLGGGAPNVPGVVPTPGARLGRVSAGVIIVRGVPGCIVGGGGIVGCPDGKNPLGTVGIVFAGTDGITGTTGTTGCTG